MTDDGPVVGAVGADTKEGQLVGDDAVDKRRREHPCAPVEAERAVLVRSSPSGRAGRVQVPICSPPDTVADYFKYRNKIGLDLAIEALHDCWEQRRCTADELMHFDGITRMANVMRPYLESLP